MIKILFFIYFAIGFAIYLYVKQSIDAIGMDTLLKMFGQDEQIPKTDFNEFGPQLIMFLVCLTLWPLFFLKQDI